MPSDEVADTVQQAMAALDASCVFELVAAYRARMEAVGFSPSAAEDMAVDYHRTLMDQ